MSKLKRVWLLKDRDYVYCFLREKVIYEEECNMYEHNLKCDENDDFWGRTHIKGTRAGHCYVEESGSVLKSCRYCLDNSDDWEEYILPQDAEVNKLSLFEKIKRRLFG